MCTRTFGHARTHAHTQKHIDTTHTPQWPSQGRASLDLWFLRNLHDCSQSPCSSHGVLLSEPPGGLCTRCCRRCTHPTCLHTPITHPRQTLVYVLAHPLSVSHQCTLAPPCILSHLAMCPPMDSLTLGYVPPPWILSHLATCILTLTLAHPSQTLRLSHSAPARSPPFTLACTPQPCTWVHSYVIVTRSL